MSLRLRLLITLAPLFVLGLIVADVGTYYSLQSFLVSRVDDQLSSGHGGAEGFLEGRRFGGGGGGGFSLPNGTWAELVDSSGTVLAGPATFTFGPLRAADPSTHPVLPSSLTSSLPAAPIFQTVDGVGTVGRYRAYSETSRSGAILIIAIPLDDVVSTLDRLVLLEGGVTGGVTLIVIAATWLMVRRGLRPLERMGDTARSIVATDLSRRVTPMSERTEVGRLGLALNSMLGALEVAFAERAAGEQRLRHFVSDASHELRTPLTSMRGYAELLRRNPDMEREDVLLAVRRIEAEAQRMGILVDDLLLLARLDQGRPLERQVIDLEALLTDACWDARAADATRVITSRVEAPAPVVGDDVRLRQAFGNLLRNAVVHTPAGTPLEVELSVEEDQGVVRIIDHGPGIPPGQAERVFERFHRADPGMSRDRGGSGLGLSITAAIIGAHGGTIVITETPGGGATFTVGLPLAPAVPLSIGEAASPVTPTPDHDEVETAPRR